ncbi:MAG: PrgI family protein, partial [Clostridia bacterium]|nr:PrgI family protein [Clostridia bacterium]
PAAVVMMIAMLPFFLFAMYERNGQPLEQVLRNVSQTLFLRPKQRPYQTNNLYAALMKQHRVGKEVRRIVQKAKA